MHEHNWAPKMLVTVCHSTQHHIPENWSFRIVIYISIVLEVFLQHSHLGCYFMGMWYSSFFNILLCKISWVKFIIFPLCYNFMYWLYEQAVTYNSTLLFFRTRACFLQYIWSFGPNSIYFDHSTISGQLPLLPYREHSLLKIQGPVTLFQLMMYVRLYEHIAYILIYSSCCIYNNLADHNKSLCSMSACWHYWLLQRVRNHSLTSLCLLSHHPFFSIFRECLFILKKLIDACNENTSPRRVGASRQISR